MSALDQATNALVEAIRVRLRCTLAVREARREVSVNEALAKLKQAHAAEASAIAELASVIAEEEGVAT